MPASYLLLKICILILPELDAPLSVERPAFDCLETLLMFGAPETVAVKLGSGTGPFSCGVPPRSIRGKLSRSHFLRGQTFGKLVYKKIPIITNESQTALIWCECQRERLKNNHIGACAIL